MKVGILSESPGDDDIHRVFIDALVGEPTRPTGLGLRERPGGWPSVRDLLHKVALFLYYRTDADALVVVVDSNHSPIHEESHDVDGAADPRCRLCQLRKALNAKFRPKCPAANRRPLKIAIGLAVPAIEAWFRCDIQTSEAAWRTGTQSGNYPYDKRQLKIAAYGTDIRVSGLATEKGIEHARLTVRRLDDLEARFPRGFGALARAIRSWRAAE